MRITLFSRQGFFFKKLVFNKRCRNEIEGIKKKYAVDPATKFPTNRFYGLGSSQRPPASVSVKIIFFSGCGVST